MDANAAKRRDNIEASSEINTQVWNMHWIIFSHIMTTLVIPMTKC